MTNSTANTLRFPPIAGMSVRAHFNGGAMSSDIGPLLLRGVDQQIGLTHRLAAAIRDSRHPSYIDHSMRDLLAQRIYQMACGYEDGNDANTLRQDPVFKMSLDRSPLDPKADLASGPTFSRLENSFTRKDAYRVAQMFVERFVDSYAKPPEVIVIDMDHSEDETHGQQELCFYNHHYGGYCYLPLFLFEGLSGKLITAVLRPGKRPDGAENASILKRVLKLLRQRWPETRIVLRGDGHFSTPGLMQRALDDPLVEFIFGLSSNAVLSRFAQQPLQQARRFYEQRCLNAQRFGQSLPHRVRVYDELEYQAGTWPQAFRVVLKAEVNSRGDNPRFIVTSLDEPDPQLLYEQLYCARGQDENYIKTLKRDLRSDRTSDHTFLANTLRLYFACAAYVLHHALRRETLVHTELAQAQPMTVITKLFKLAVRVIPYKDRIKLQLPSGCPVQPLLQRITELLYRLPAPAWDTG